MQGISEKINVTIDKILVHKEDTGWTLGVGFVKSENKKITFKGNLYCCKGEKITMGGTWEEDARYGMQFVVASAEKNEDMTEEDLITYLREFPLIGVARANKIVKEYGTSALEVLRTDYLKIVSLCGIPEETAYQMHSQVVKAETTNALIRFLQPKGLSLHMVRRIAEDYGPRAIEIIKKNPFRLYKDGYIEFGSAEYIAKKLGISSGTEAYIGGVLLSEMEKMTKSGNCYMNVKDLQDKAVKFLRTKGKTNENKIFSSICDMSDRENLIIEEGDAFLPEYYYSEVYSGLKIDLLRKTVAKYKLNRKAEEIFDELNENSKIKYAPEQEWAIKTALDAKLMILTGGPGTGKTATVNGIIKAFYLNNPDSKIVCCAPTGKAAKRMEESTGMPASTIHRLLEYKFEKGVLSCRKNAQNPIDADIIIIDEFSMVDILLFDKLLRAVNPYTKLIIVGDIDQLPSVGAGNVLADLIGSDVVTTVRLVTVFRQAAESPIVSNAYKINSGNIPVFNDVDFTLEETGEETEEEVAERCVNLYCELLEEGESVSTVQILSPKKRNSPCGSGMLNSAIQKRVNPVYDKRNEILIVLGQHYLSYRTGDKVIQTKNNYEKGCFNGDTGFITKVSRDKDTISVHFDNGMDIDFTGKEEIMELELAYALTIHKSQGSEYPTVIMPVVNEHVRFLTKNLLYTGVTRAKKNLFSVGSLKAWELGCRNTVLDKRNSKLKDRIQY